MPTLSKTDFILYRACPKNAWMKIHRPEVYYASELSEFEQHIIETGNEVELVARQLFPTGILVEGRGETAQKLTAEYIANRQAVIFQPVFIHNGFLAAVDILSYDSATDGYAIYEVKASNEIDEKVHWYDLAFQVVLLRQCGLNITSINLIHLNKDYVRSGALDVAKLFSTDDVGEEIATIIAEVEQEMNLALTYVSETVEPAGFCCCVYKGRSNHCTTFAHSNPSIPEYSVHDIARIGSSKKKLTELIDTSVFHIHDIPEQFELSAIQKNQVDAHVTGRAIIHHGKIAAEFRALEYPLYFIDYETFPSAIPLFKGFSPYQQIPFQYSLYVLDTPDSEPRHCEFLHIKTNDPSEDFWRSLEKNIGAIGSVVVWNKRFECMINRELAARIPESAPLMESMNDRVFDLMEIFSKQLFVHPDFKGSFSIKKVLPVLVPELSYKDLAIQEGGTASKSWHALVSGECSVEEAEAVAEALKVYCGMDTYAMYAIWRKLYLL